jgi:hypothetical protein
VAIGTEIEQRNRERACAGMEASAAGSDVEAGFTLNPYLNPHAISPMQPTRL